MGGNKPEEYVKMVKETAEMASGVRVEGPGGVVVSFNNYEELAKWAREKAEEQK